MGPGFRLLACTELMAREWFLLTLAYGVQVVLVSPKCRHMIAILL